MTGIGGYDLSSGADESFAFDYDGSGKADHLVLYRPGSGIVYIVQNSGGSFSPVFTSSSGIGGYDLASGADLGFAFDYDSSGKADHLVFYRPGRGAIFIVKRTGSTFTHVYAQGDQGSGIGTYDLSSGSDRCFAFDYDGSGKLDHLVLYRPGTGIVYILKNSGGSFSPVFASNSGIGGYDLSSGGDRALAFDYDSSHKLDHLVFYRPGRGAMFILKRTGATFTHVYAQGDPGSGIGGYDLSSGADRCCAFDYDSSGKLDHLVLYRPGAGAAFVLKNAGGVFTAVYAQAAGGSGIGGYDLHGGDLAFAFDYNSNGKANHLVFYRPGTGICWILQNAGGTFGSVYSAEPPDAMVNQVASGIRIHVNGAFAIENFRIGFEGRGPCGVDDAGITTTLAGQSVTIKGGWIFNGSIRNSSIFAQVSMPFDSNLQMWPIIDVMSGASDHAAGHNVMYDPNSPNTAVYNIVGGNWTPGFSFQEISSDAP